MICPRRDSLNRTSSLEGKNAPVPVQIDCEGDEEVLFQASLGCRRSGAKCCAAQRPKHRPFYLDTGHGKWHEVAAGKTMFPSTKQELN